MNNITEKQILEWKEQLKNHKERLQQAQTVAVQESKLISLIEGGIQFGETLQKKNELANQPSDTKDTKPQPKTAQSN